MKKIELIIHHEIPVTVEAYNVSADFSVPMCITCFDIDSTYRLGDRVKIVPKNVTLSDSDKKCIYMKITSVIRGVSYGLKPGEIMLGLTKINL